MASLESVSAWVGGATRPKADAHSEDSGPQWCAHWGGGAYSGGAGRSGRRIIEGIIAQKPKVEILEGLSYHVRYKLDVLRDVLSLECGEHSLWMPQELIRQHDDDSARIKKVNERMEQALQAH